MSAFSDRSFGLRRAAATVAHRPGRFLLSVLLGTTALATLLLLIALAYTASLWAARVQAGPEVSLFVTPGTAPRELDELVKDRSPVVDNILGTAIRGEAEITSSSSGLWASA